MSYIDLSAKQIKFLRGQAHALKPVIIIGQHGLSEAVLAELEQALNHHELLKVRVNAEDRDNRDAMIERICDTLKCAFVQKIGHVATFYRPNPDVKRIELPKR